MNKFKITLTVFMGASKKKTYLPWKGSGVGEDWCNTV